MFSWTPESSPSEALYNCGGLFIAATVAVFFPLFPRPPQAITPVSLPSRRSQPIRSRLEEADSFPLAGCRSPAFVVKTASVPLRRRLPAFFLLLLFLPFPPHALAENPASRLGSKLPQTFPNKVSQVLASPSFLKGNPCVCVRINKGPRVVVVGFWFFLCFWKAPLRKLREQRELEIRREFLTRLLYLAAAGEIAVSLSSLYSHSLSLCLLSPSLRRWAFYSRFSSCG